jgi:environmental stress-induced protein Ves
VERPGHRRDAACRCRLRRGHRLRRSQGPGSSDGGRLSEGAQEGGGDRGLRLLEHAAYRLRPWRNRQGLSRDIAAGDGWQLSLADIEQSGRFSDFAGWQRHFALVAGAVVLSMPRAGPIACSPSSPIVVFDGGEPPDCQVLDGPARAFNLIVATGRYDARLERHALGDRPAAIEGRAGGGVVAVLVQSGRVECRLQAGNGNCVGVGMMAAAGDSVLDLDLKPDTDLVLHAVSRSVSRSEAIVLVVRIGSAARAGRAAGEAG